MSQPRTPLPLPHLMPGRAPRRGPRLLRRCGDASDGEHHDGAHDGRQPRDQEGNGVAAQVVVQDA